MIELYRLDYVSHAFEEIRTFKNYILVSLKNSIGMLWDIFLVNKDKAQDFFNQDNWLKYKKYDVEIKDLTIMSIVPVIKTRVSSTLFMVIFSAEIIDIIIWSKRNIDNILTVN
jgi:hypothetical protein